jgi:hypothetical protein
MGNPFMYFETGLGHQIIEMEEWNIFKKQGCNAMSSKRLKKRH